MAKQRKHSKRRAMKQKKRRMAQHARENQGGKTNDLPTTQAQTRGI
ncbi:hypothetical protein [Levilactobacillus tujiorum]|nr:hypothetical protein [Levilactobacillus tujiorum]NLR32746.1 hypothetical protein [Levilactobacillus tujiorum]